MTTGCILRETQYGYWNNGVIDLIVSKYAEPTTVGGWITSNSLDHNPIRSFSIEDDVTNFEIYDGCLYDVTNKYLLAAPYGKTSVEVKQGTLGIGNKAFHHQTSLTALSGDTQSLTAIGHAAFQNCTALSSFTFSNTLTSIGERAFYNTGLTSLSVSNTNLVIGNYAFSTCNSLVSATLGVKSVGNYCFQNCHALTSINFTALGSSGLGIRFVEGSSSLSYLHVPATLTSASGSFTGLSSLIKTAGPTGGGYNFEYDWTTVIGGQYCLSLQGGLEEITFPATSTQLANYLTHTSCTNVTKIYCYAMTAPTAYAYTFTNVGDNTKDSGTNELHVPVGATGYDAGQWANLVNNKGFTLIYDL